MLLRFGVGERAGRRSLGLLRPPARLRRSHSAERERWPDVFVGAAQQGRRPAGIRKAVADLLVQEGAAREEEIARQLHDTEKQIETLLERIAAADSASVIKAYEDKIAGLERENLLLSEKSTRIVPPKGRLEEFIEPALEFLGISWDIYENRRLPFKRTVLGLTFAEPLRHSLDSGLSNR